MTDSGSQQSMSFPQRIVNIFVAPSKVFQFLAGRPLWIAPMILVTVFSVAVLSFIFSTPQGTEAMRQQMLENPRTASMPPEQMEQAMKIGKIFGGVSYLIFIPVVTFAASGLVYLLFSIVMGAEASYKQTLSAWTHSSLVGLPQGLVGSGMILVKSSFKSSTSLAAFLPFLEESSFLYKLFQGVDIFIVWQLAVLSIGMGIMNRIETKKAAIAIFSTYFVIILIIAGIRQAMS